MILTEQVPVADVDLPVQAFREHLQLGTGFAEDGLQDAVLIQNLKAAISFVEGRTGKAILTREFMLKVLAWRHYGRQILPIAPVEAVRSFAIVEMMGDRQEIASDDFVLAQDTHEPVLQSTGFALPIIPVGGHAEIIFDAGLGDWDKVPADIRQAVFLLAAHYYENRSAGSLVPSTPVGVSAICRRYAAVRLNGAHRK